MRQPHRGVPQGVAPDTRNEAERFSFAGSAIRPMARQLTRRPAQLAAVVADEHDAPHGTAAGHGGHVKARTRPGCANLGWFGS